MRADTDVSYSFHFILGDDFRNRNESGKTMNISGGFVIRGQVGNMVVVGSLIRALSIST
jgi:hypothetical protein